MYHFILGSNKKAIRLCVRHPAAINKRHSNCIDFGRIWLHPICENCETLWSAGITRKFHFRRRKMIEISLQKSGHTLVCYDHLVWACGYYYETWWKRKVTCTATTIKDETATKRSEEGNSRLNIGFVFHSVFMMSQCAFDLPWVIEHEGSRKHAPIHKTHGPFACHGIKESQLNLIWRSKRDVENAKKNLNNHMVSWLRVRN